MKRLIMILCILACSTLAGLSPITPYKTMLIPQGTVIQPYEALIKAVVMVESGGDCMAYNAREGAVGAFQVRAIRLRDFNNRTGKSYKLSDMYNYFIAKEVFLFYAVGDYETIARSWNGSGKKTIKYWHNIKKYL